MINLIYAVNKKGVIGANGGIPWNIPEDLDYFKVITLGGFVLMGRLTWESLPRKPLPHRTNVVISSKDYADFDVKPDIKCSSVNSVLIHSDLNRIFVIGGERLLKELEPKAMYVYRTMVDDNSDGDTFAPELSEDTYDIIHSRKHKSINGYEYETQILKRKE